MVNKIKASIELSMLVFIMSSLIIGIGVYGIVEIRLLNKTSEKLVKDRMFPMDQLGDVRYYSTNILAIAQEANKKQLTYSDALSKISKAQDSINANWKAYLKTNLTPKEKSKVALSLASINQSNVAIEKLKLALAHEEEVALEKIVDKELFPALNPVSEKIAVLLAIQVDEAKKMNKENAKIYTNYTQKFLGILLIALLFAIPFSYYLIKKNGIIINSFNLNNAKLFLTEKNYRNLIEYAGEAILILNEETEIIDLNEYATQLLGYTRQEMLLMKISALVAPEDVKVQARDINYIKKHKFATLYRKIRKKDGTYIETEISNRLMEGKGFFAIIRDITQRKKIESTIKESEEKYRYLFNNNPAYIIIWDLETLAILEVNEAVLEKYGYTQEEWTSMTVLDYRPEEEHHKIKEFARYMMENDEPIAKRNWRHYKKTGEEMIMEITSHKIKYNNRNAILSLARDVTDQTIAEAKLMEREAQLDLFIEHSPASLAMLDTDMRYIATSRRWITDYNLVNQEIIGKSHYEVFPEIGAEWKAIHQRCLQGIVDKCEEDSFLRADGSLEWLKWEIRPWYKATGEIGGVIMLTEVITERKKATELFQKQFENSPDIILYVNRFYKIEAVNRGVSMAKEDLIGLDCISVLPEESKTIAEEALQKCFATGENQEIENTLSNGNWVRSRFVPILTNGEVTHVMIFATDMTERKQAEIKLLQSEEKYRALTENISDAIVLVNEDFEIEYQSKSAELIAGYRFEESQSKSVFGFIYPDDLSSAKAFFNQVLHSPEKPINNQFRVIHKSGHVIWVEGTVLNLLNNENIKGIIINYRDITNRKRYEEQQALMASIVNSSDDAIISKSLEGIITSWNKGAEKVLGYTSDEIIGKHITVLIPLDYREEEKSIIDAMRRGVAVEHYETRRMKKNGELIYVSLTISPIIDVNGTIIGASKIMRDISERKKFEDDLIHYNEELKKTNAELDRFVYSTSHDLRAPLKSMLGLINITKTDIEEKAPSAENSGLIERLNMLNKSASKLDNFIEDILNYSRNARLESVYEEIDFEDLVKEVKANLKFTDEKKIDFTISVNSKQPFVSDYQRLAVVLNNIISNAYKYSDTTKEKSFINVTFAADKTKATIIIEDNGVGIPESDQEKIFDMFYRSTTLSTGSGIGLYIVKETMHKLGGTIRVESEVGKGSKFYIEIPNQLNS
ncbi:PAS domain S-box protein [Flavobacterium sp. XGLA_31]|uniref:PAS domain S-box protein n=1 Tax=Flavobacterium sp. XGLA_31 TaxID=3447666 RepID=UPI003F3E10B5